MNTVLFDIDETIYSNHSFPSNIDTIKKIIKELENEYSFGICTNRPYDDSVRKIVNTYEFNGPLLIEGGAGIYKKINGRYKLIDTFEDYSCDINALVDLKLSEFIGKDNYHINKNRKYSSTVIFNDNVIHKMDDAIEFLRNNCLFKNNRLMKDKVFNDRIHVDSKNLNKVESIKKYFKNENVIFVTDYEKLPLPKYNNIKIYSVGDNKDFNDYSHKVFSTYSKGVEEILNKIRKEGDSRMKDYEQISENCKMLWKEGFKITKQRYTQVSGYIFNDKNQLLVVKSKKTWTIPGGHPIKGETKLQSLKREVMEEALVTLKNVKYLGAVEVVENGETYYQLRYTAKVKEELPFNPTHETNERAFVDLDDLINYITWSNGIAFSAQIESAKKVWDI